MAFDPRLILGHQQYAGPDANQTMRTLADLAGRRTQQQVAQASLADMLRKQGREQRLSDVYRANAGAPEALPSALMGEGFGGEAASWMDQQAQTETRRAQSQKAMQETLKARTEMFARALGGGVRSQAELDQALAAARASGITDGELTGLTVYNEQTAPLFERFVAMGVPAEKRVELDARSSEAQKRRAFEEAERAKDRANRTKNAGIMAGNMAEARAAKREDAFGDDTRDLRKEISSRKEIAKYRQASAELSSLKELAKETSGASDMALVFAFMKAMDPDSVVRESEYAAAAATGTPDERMMGLVSKYWTGGPLSKGQRQSFIRAAEAAQSGHKAAFERAAKTYRHVAKKRGYDLEELGLEDGEPPRPMGGLSPEEAQELADLEAEMGGEP